MTNPSLIILWFRRDLRLADHSALNEAVQSGRPIIPVFICDPLVEAQGAAPRWRLGLGVQSFAKNLQSVGSRLVFRQGDALTVLKGLIAETGAQSVYWSRAYDPDTIERDKLVKVALTNQGITAQSFKGHLLFEPWVPKTKAGTEFKVYSPFWRCVSRDHSVEAGLPAPKSLTVPSDWPDSDDPADCVTFDTMNRGAEIVLPHTCVGEAAALKRLNGFLDNAVDQYKAQRDFPSIEATSRLSENLTYGEISPRTVWHAGRLAMDAGAQGAEHFLKELVWREFAYHLLFNFPTLPTQNWRPEWSNFEWQGASEKSDAWMRGQTGVEIIDAGMRELYVTGTMHNRVRMIAASYLTKHLRTDWRVGLKWFEECLIDWDPASNAMGWQWVAGCGPDAAPYFRIFNPETQAEKFDKDRAYRSEYLSPTEKGAQDFVKATPRSWGDLLAGRPRDPIVALDVGRNRALAAYERLKEQNNQ